MANVDYLNELRRYEELSGIAIIETTMLFDLAVASEKLMSWDCVGLENEAWRTGPYLASGQGEEPIDHSKPYCLANSKELGVVAGIVVGPNPLVSTSGAIQIPTNAKRKGIYHSEPQLAKLAIITQFELYKHFAKRVRAPFNKATISNEKSLSSDGADLLRKITDRRNEIVHDYDHEAATIRESIDIFIQLKWIAALFVECKSGLTGLADPAPWKHLAASKPNR